MENNKSIEKIYELIEQYDFAELSEQDRLIVLAVMSESEYNEMRKTVDNLKLELTPDVEPEINMPKIEKVNSDSRIRRFLNYPIKFYQVAASIVVIISAFYMFQNSDKNISNQMIANNDTIVIRHIDTVYSIVNDTVEIIIEKVRTVKTDFQKQEEHDLIAYSNMKSDCSKNLCPNEIEDIITMNSVNTIKNDSTIKGVLLSLN